MISVDPERRSDPFYRYQMAELDICYERKGNRTGVYNLAQVARDLGRPTEALLRHLRCVLGTRVQELAGHHVINGLASEEKLLEAIDLFSRDLVLCAVCRCPETDLLTRKKNMWFKCRACGHATRVTSSLRVVGYLHAATASAQQSAEALQGTPRAPELQQPRCGDA